MSNDAAQNSPSQSPDGNRAASETRQSASVLWSALLFGAVLALAFQFTLALLGAGLGMGLAADTRLSGTEKALGYAGGAFVLVGSLLSFAAGGFAASSWARCRDRVTACFCGWGTWAVCTLVLLFFAMAGGATLLGGLFLRAGMPHESASMAQTFIRELQAANFRVVTDMQLFEGKAITSMVIGKDAPGAQKSPTGQVAADLAEREDPKLSPAARKKAEQMAEAAAMAGFLGFAGLLLSAFASWAGSFLAFKRAGPVPRAG